MTEAIILAGGLGTRLKDVVSDVPKPMAPIRGRPFLCYLLDELIAFGITHAVLSVGYRSHTILNYLGARYKTLELSYSHEETPMGTGGGIALAIQKCSGNRVFIFNGDTFVGLHGVSAQKLLKSSGDCFIFGKSLKISDRYGVLEVADGRVIGFSEKVSRENAIIYLGCGLYPTRLLRAISALVPSNFEKDFLEDQVKVLKPKLVLLSDLFIDIGIPDDYSKAQMLLVHR